MNGGVLILLFLLATQPPAKVDYTELFRSVWTAVDEHFYDPSFLGVNWKAVRRRYEPRVASAHSDAEFAALMRQMLNELPVTHLGLHPPERETKVGLAITKVEVQGKHLISSVDVMSDAQRQGLRPGDLLLSQDKEVEGLWGTIANARVRGCDGRVATRRVHREPQGWPPEFPSVRWRQIRPTAQKKLGYIRISQFGDDFAPLADRAMADLKDTEGIIIDVRDNSGGNASFLRLVSYFTPKPEFTFSLLSRGYLDRMGTAPEHLDRDMIANLPHVDEAYTTAAILDAMKNNGGGAAFYTADVGTNPYRSKVVVLINGQTGSAAEGFAGIMKGRPNTVLVGRSTEGALVGAESFDLPRGWSLSVPTHAAWKPDGHLWRDEPVRPDLEVRLTRRDLCHAFDADMAKAVDLLNGK